MISLLKEVYHRFLGFLPDYGAVQLIYLRAFGKFADFEHPRTLNEKISWRKLYQHDPRFAVFSDKIAVKENIRRLAGENCIVPILWTGERPEEIPFDHLTPPYVIKLNHISGGNIFIREGKDIDRDKICRSLRKRLKLNQRDIYAEWGYSLITKKILIETMLLSDQGKIPDDYKFFVYHGRVHFIQGDYDRFGDYRENFYDTKWRRLPMTWGDEKGTTGNPPAPSSLSEMIALAEKIGALFDFVRVDLYTVASGVYFGETTFYPAGGAKRIRPALWDYKLGEPWKLAKDL
jgi:hypothetical protein